MKKIVSTIVAVGLTASAFSQGQVNFENNAANGFVVESSASDTTGNTSGTYIDAPTFTAELWAIETPTSTTAGINGLDAFGNLNPADLVSDGFVELSSAGNVSNLAGTAGAFGGSGTVMNVPGVTASQTVFAVVAWTGSATTFAAADVTGNYVGILAFLNSTAGAPPAGLTGADDIATGWNTLSNSPRSAAEGDSEDLIMNQVTATPEPTTLAFAGLGGLSVLLFRRRK
jgi:uncharacterized protein (TIGR03382 family)